MLRIISAIWGYYNFNMDVTNELNNLISGGNLSFAVSYKSFSEDPCRGFVKDLRITYAYNDIHYHIIVQEQSGSNVKTLNIINGSVRITNTTGTHGKGYMVTSL